MKIKKLQITGKIFLLVFENQFDITSTFLRFQEFYESPKFRGKVFTLEEFKKWYTSLKGTFSYYTDWNGFNIPAHILQPFYNGDFNPLSEKEKKLLELFKKEKGKFYIIGVHRNIKDISKLLNHEVAHGLFYTDEKYHKKVLEIISKFDVEDIKNELRSKGGYSEEVLVDEVHAYVLDSVQSLKAKIPVKMHKQLQNNFQKTLQKLDLDSKDFFSSFMSL